jgi:hypothetical protein
LTEVVALAYWSEVFYQLEQSVLEQEEQEEHVRQLEPLESLDL